MKSFKYLILLIVAVLFIPTVSTSSNLDKSFPYGQEPAGNVCVTSDQYATPETMLGSWAMNKALEKDLQSGVLPKMFQAGDVVYSVGTAAIGNFLDIPNCSGGCNQLNGFCFALKFNNKEASPKYMIFQSVNIAANSDSFDIYMAGGGAGAFPNFCAKFWGPNVANWSANILHYQSCSDYFNYENVTSNYAVTYEGKTYSAKDTLKNACEYASKTGFNKQNFSNVTVVPVSCPQSLTQISGLRLVNTEKVGTKKIIKLQALTESDFDTSPIVVKETTQMQDCKTPSSGYCHNVTGAAPNYEASISAGLDKPLLAGTPPSDNYCQKHSSTAGFCSWDNGQSSGSDYCNQSEGICHSCGNSPKWCVCDGGKMVKCS